MERDDRELNINGAGLVRAGDPPLCHRDCRQQLLFRRARPVYYRRIGRIQPDGHLRRLCDGNPEW